MHVQVRGHGEPLDVHACAYMHMCMHMCMHVCMHMCMHVCMHIYMHVCMHTCMHTCMHMYMHVQVRSYGEPLDTRDVLGERPAGESVGGVRGGGSSSSEVSTMYICTAPCTYARQQ